MGYLVELSEAEYGYGYNDYDYGYEGYESYDVDNPHDRQAQAPSTSTTSNVSRHIFPVFLIGLLASLLGSFFALFGHHKINVVPTVPSPRKCAQQANTGYYNNMQLTLSILLDLYFIYRYIAGWR